MTDNERKEKLKYLISCLEDENPRYKNYEAPDDPDEAFNLYRALCNVRMPVGPTGHTLPEQFYQVQSEVLKGHHREKRYYRCFITSICIIRSENLFMAGRYHCIKV